MWLEKPSKIIFLSIFISFTLFCSKEKLKKPSQETIEMLINIKTKLENHSDLLEKKTKSPKELMEIKKIIPIGKKQKKEIRLFLAEEDIKKFLNPSEKKLKTNLLTFDKTKKIKHQSCNSFIYYIKERYVIEAIEKLKPGNKVREIVDIVGPDGKRYFLNGT